MAFIMMRTRDGTWYLAAGALIALGSLFAVLGWHTYRDLPPLAAYADGLDIPEDRIVTRGIGELTNRKRRIAFRPYRDIAWYFVDDSRPWTGMKIGLRDGSLALFPQGRPSSRGSFLAVLSRFVRRASEDSDVLDAIRRLDADPEAYEWLWHYNPRRPLPTGFVSISILGASVGWLPLVFLRAWSFLPVVVVTSVAFGIWFAIGTRHLLKRQVRCLSLVDPGTDWMWSFLERSFGQMGAHVRVVSDRPSGWFARRSYDVGGLIVRVNRLPGSIDPRVQWRVVVEESANEVAVRGARRTLARSALEESLLPTTHLYVRAALDAIRERARTTPSA